MIVKTNAECTTVVFGHFQHQLNSNHAVEKNSQLIIANKDRFYLEIVKRQIDVFDGVKQQVNVGQTRQKLRLQRQRISDI